MNSFNQHRLKVKNHPMHTILRRGMSMDIIEDMAPNWLVDIREDLISIMLIVEMGLQVELSLRRSKRDYHHLHKNHQLKN